MAAKDALAPYSYLGCKLFHAELDHARAGVKLHIGHRRCRRTLLTSCDPIKQGGQQLGMSLASLQMGKIHIAPNPFRIVLITPSWSVCLSVAARWKAQSILRLAHPRLVLQVSIP